MRRDDGWMVVEMGSFYNHHDDAGTKLVGANAKWKSGLIIEGIEFQPKTRFDDSEHKCQIISLDDMGGNKCYMVGAELTTAWIDNLDYWQWKACAESRFSEVAELF